MIGRVWKKAFCVLTALLLVLSCSPVRAEGAPQKKVTVMVYMCGADLEVMGKGTSTISQMYSSRFSQEDVNVIVLCGGTRKWMSGLDANVLSVVDVGKGGRRSVHVAEELPSASMGQPETLTGFLKLCYEKYPAESYDLVLWDHGGGPVGGVCWDQKYREDQLTTLEVTQALAASPFANRGLDLLVMHACLMGSAEFANSVSPFAKYYVASEDSQYGLSYDWLKGIEQAGALETASKIVDDSFAFNRQVIESNQEAETNSFAVIDLSRMPELKEAVNDFFAGLTVDMDTATFTAMSAHRRDSQAFGLGESGGDSDFDLVDLGDLVRHYREFAPEKADAVLAAIQNAVVYRQSVNEGCSGLTVYHPYRNRSRAASRMETYETLGFAENYYAYIQQFTARLTGEPQADWVELNTEVPAASKDVRTLFILPLTAEQAAQYGESSLKALQKDGENYTFTFMSRETALDGETVTGEYIRNALFAVGQDGTALTEPVTYAVDGRGQWVIPATLVKYAGEETDAAEHQALISCSYDRESRKLIPGAVRVLDEGTGGYTSAYGTVFSNYDEIRLTFVSRKETRNEKGTLLPFDAWEVSDTREWSGKLDGSWDFVLVPDSVETSSMYVTFEVTDSQNNLYSSELTALSREKDDPVTTVVYDDTSLILGKPGVSMLADNLLLSFAVTNRTEAESIVALKNLKVNGTALDDTAEAYGTGENWGLLQDEEQMISLQVSKAKLPEGILTEITFDLILQDAATGEEKAVVPVNVGLHLDPNS